MSAHELLYNLSLFSELTDTEIDVIAPLCHEVAGQAGDRIIEEGEPVRYLYILLSGEVSIHKRRADGQYVALASVGKDAVLGELTFFKFTPASATVKATEPFKALAIDQANLQRLLDTDSKIGSKLYKKLALVAGKRLKTMISQYAESISSP